MNETILLLSILTSALFCDRVQSFQHHSAVNGRWHQQGAPHITFRSEKRNRNINYAQNLLRLAGKDSSVNEDFNGIIGDGIDLKAELTAYLKKREEVGADEAAKDNVGKVIGGTKGNAILEYVSGAPNKAFTIEAPPDIFDYDELTKYGFGYLVTPIMDANIGGRRTLYKLMDLPPPPPPKPRVVSVRKLVFDKTGEEDEARYTGLKVSQIVDDDEMGRRLEEIRKKTEEGKSLRPKLIEEEYKMPFSDGRNTGPRQTPEWTPEMLDEEGLRAGKAMAWAKAARSGEFKKDPYERMNIEGSLQVYSIVTAVLFSFAFGSSSSSFLSVVLGINASTGEDGVGFFGILQGLSLVLILNAAIASVLCGGVFAPKLNRNSFVWGIKGLAGGPLAIIQLRSLDTLKTRGEIEAE